MVILMRVLCLLVMSYFSYTTIIHSMVSQVDDPLCGPRSLKMIFERFGIESSLNDICEESGYNKKSGTSMYGLYTTAINNGLPAKALRMDLDDLCNIGEYCIAFTHGNHFLVVMECEKDSVLVANPPESKGKFSKEHFKKLWDGEVLVFSSKVISQLEKKKQEPKYNEMSNFTFAYTNYDYGIVNDGSMLTHKFIFTNSGTDTLHVRARSGCNCISALVSDRYVPPGESGYVHVEFNTSGYRGESSQSVLVRTDDPVNKLIKLTISATVVGNITLKPNRIYLDNLKINEKITKTIEVIDTGDKSLIINDVVVSDGIHARILPAKTDSTGLLSVPVAFDVSMDIKGAFNKYVTIITNNEKQQELPILIYGNAVE